MKKQLKSALKKALKILLLPIAALIGLIGIILMVLGDRDGNDERKTT